MQIVNELIHRNNLNSALGHLNNENRIITTPWSRIVRGLGLGQYPIDYSEKISLWIQNTFDELKDKTESRNNYVNFSSLLCDLICLLVKPNQKLNDADRQAYILNIFSLINLEFDPYRRIMQYTITIDSLAKLNINLFNCLEGYIDLPGLLFKSINEIKSNCINDENSGKHGEYEKLSAYTSVFIALAVCGKAEIAVNDAHNHIADALKTLDKIPSPFFRGRGGSMLFSAISLLGYGEALYGHGRNYIVEILDYLDNADTVNINPSFPQSMTPHFVKIYPLLTLLNAIAVTGHLQALNYRQDRVRQVSIMMEALTPVERTHMGLYYIMALHNLGLIDQEQSSINSLVADMVHTAININPSENYFLHGIAISYVIETAMITGKQHLISDRLINTLAESFSTMNKSIDDEINRPYPVAYALTMLSEAGYVDKMFKPSPNYDNKSAISWVTHNLTQIGDGTDGRLYMLNHALLNLMLRMRGTNFPELDVYKYFSFSK